MTNRIFSYFFIAFIGLTSAFFFLVAILIFLVTGLFDRRGVILHLFSSFWASLYLWCMPLVSVQIRGRKKLNWKKRYIIVSNHQSQLDILAAFGLFFPFKWVSKAEVFRLPFIGWNMILNRYIKLRRGDRSSVARMMRSCTQALRKGCSLYFFPEGTRSRTGELKPFKPGAFILAKETQTPVLPVVIEGTRDVLPKNSLVLNSRKAIRVCVLDEVPVSALKDRTPEEIAHAVRKTIGIHRDRLRRELGTLPSGISMEAPL